ncbi:antibiotic biosynthesis monooxygenase [Amorphus sp. 3PC139-8]|uniref:antibiotic biosynthesis monooxygenase family protein n=1 Tax=Amorphus sp. 3PC139-8 TaxID=2735676 RepID=UPI00345D141F
MTRRSPLSTAAAAAATLATAVPAAADVTLINVFEIPPGQEERVITAWEKARDFLKEEPGYVTTALHRAVSPNARFALVNVATWESPEAFMVATKRMQDANIFPDIEGLGVNPALYRIVRRDDGASSPSEN